MPYVPGATDGVVSVQTTCPLESVEAAGGQVEKRPGGPLNGALSTQERPTTGAPVVVATTVTVNVSPVASVRDESVMLRMKFVAVFVSDASVAVDEGVAEASAWPGAVPLMTGPFGVVDDCLPASV
jgi:hypothetical protein